PSDPSFVNGVVRLGTSLPPHALLLKLHEVELALGRVRGRRNAPRAIDLDLIDHDGAVIAEEGLVLPHPRLATRAFVLLPLADVAPDWRHPVTGQAVSALIERLGRDQCVEPLANTHG
ncbi:MAG: 2-amino-4-hydroxy-6-hydroxymethyldihydropteridine diphosphokinase, partial [Alphaproteobacteria bacterium]|nr:2-amino-4-hydroxy-6-hydroxymethyldihydropteridine diphosphokinase [Alphaproteobacteria bacterium]